MESEELEIKSKQASKGDRTLLKLRPFVFIPAFWCTVVRWYNGNFVLLQVFKPIICQSPNFCVCEVGWEGINCEICVRLPGSVNGYCSNELECNFEQFPFTQPGNLTQISQFVPSQPTSQAQKFGNRHIPCLQSIPLRKFTFKLRTFVFIPAFFLA